MLDVNPNILCINLAWGSHDPLVMQVLPCMVTDYLGALGANPFEVGFYKSATLIERRGSLNEGPLFSTFEAARLRFGLS